MSELANDQGQAWYFEIFRFHNPKKQSPTRSHHLIFLKECSSLKINGSHSYFIHHIPLPESLEFQPFQNENYIQSNFKSSQSITVSDV